MTALALLMTMGKEYLRADLDVDYEVIEHQAAVSNSTLFDPTD